MRSIARANAITARAERSLHRFVVPRAHKRPESPLALPIQSHLNVQVPVDGSTFGASRCEPDGEDETCTITQSAEVYDTMCKKCRGNRLVLTRTRRGGKYVERACACMACAGTGVVRVATTRFSADFAGDDSEAAYYQAMEREVDVPEKRDHFRLSPFSAFEKQSAVKMKKRESTRQGSIDERGESVR